MIAISAPLCQHCVIRGIRLLLPGYCHACFLAGLNEGRSRYAFVNWHDDSSNRITHPLLKPSSHLRSQVSDFPSCETGDHLPIVSSTSAGRLEEALNARAPCCLVPRVPRRNGLRNDRGNMAAKSRNEGKTERGNVATDTSNATLECRLRC